MKIIENIDLSTLSYMKIGGTGKYLIEIEEEKELHKVEEISREEKLPVIVLGEGSNTIFSDGTHEKIFVRIQNKDILKTYDSVSGCNMNVGAGTNWDEFVSWTIDNNLSGLETTSGIPGTVGASPIQNVGAYGQEVSDVITHVRVFSLEDNEFYEIPNNECLFGYRDSIFKQNLGKFIITSVSFRLSKDNPKVPTYKDLALYFLSKRKKDPSLEEIREAVLNIRNKKIPDPKTNPNCGSFFQNPIVPTSQANVLIQKFPDMPHYQVSEDEIKLQGGWLIEKSGLKGKEVGKNKKILVNPNSALVLISNPGSTWNDLMDGIREITEKVEKNFGVHLETEPNLIR